MSLLIETKPHIILFDMGQSDAFAKNAERLGIDLSPGIILRRFGSAVTPLNRISTARNVILALIFPFKDIQGSGLPGKIRFWGKD